MTDTFYAVAAVASAVAAVLAWAAKLAWSREYAAAKDEIIKAKDAQIEGLRQQLATLQELTPMRIREYFVSVKQQLEEYNDFLQQRLTEAKSEIAGKEHGIAALRTRGTDQTARIQQLQRERDEIRTAATTVERQLAALRAKYESPDTVVFKVPRIDPKTFEAFAKSAEALRNALAHQRQLVDWTQFQNQINASRRIREAWSLIDAIGAEPKKPEAAGGESSVREPDHEAPPDA